MHIIFMHIIFTFIPQMLGVKRGVVAVKPASSSVTQKSTLHSGGDNSGSALQSARSTTVQHGVIRFWKGLVT